MLRALGSFALVMMTVAPQVLAQARPNAQPSPRLPAADSAVESEVRATDAARFAAMTHSDFAALDTLLGADLNYTHSDGTRESKFVFLTSLRSGQLTYLTVRPDSLLVRVYGSTAVADGRIAVRVRADKQVGSFTARFLEVYAHRGGRWELVAWQSTRVTRVVWEK